MTSPRSFSFRLGLPPILTCCFATTNIIESPNGGLKAKNLQGESLEERKYDFTLGGLSFLSAEKNFRRIMGYKDIWTLEPILGRSTVTRIDKYKNLA